jgi:hypothetical protein
MSANDPALQILSSISQDIRDIRESQMETASFIGESRQDRKALHQQADNHDERITHLERTMEKLLGGENFQKKKKTLLFNIFLPPSSLREL